jgi:hypothetical protein
MVIRIHLFGLLPGFLLPGEISMEIGSALIL